MNDLIENGEYEENIPEKTIDDYFDQTELVHIINKLFCNHVQ